MLSQKLLTRRLSVSRQKTELEDVYRQIHEFIDNINSLHHKKIQCVQHEYAEIYKQQMHIMHKQLSDIKYRLQQALCKDKELAKMQAITEERNFFRASAEKCDQQLKKMTKLNKQLQENLKNYQQELKDHKQICLKLKQKINELKSEILVYNQTQRGTVKEKLENQDQIVKISNSSRTWRYSSPFNIQGQQRRKNLNLKSMTTVRPVLSNNREICLLVEDCIKQLKKQIFYRNIKSDSDLHKLYFNQGQFIIYDRLTNSDKKQLVYRIASNEVILRYFYDFLIRNIEVSRTPVEVSHLKKKFQQRLAAVKNI